MCYKIKIVLSFVDSGHFSRWWGQPYGWWKGVWRIGSDPDENLASKELEIVLGDFLSYKIETLFIVIQNATVISHKMLDLLLLSMLTCLLDIHGSFFSQISQDSFDACIAYSCLNDPYI